MTFQHPAAPRLEPAIAALEDRIAAWLEGCGTPQLFSALMQAFPEEHGALLVRDAFTNLNAPIWHWGGVSCHLAIALWRLQAHGRVWFPACDRADYEACGLAPDPRCIQLWTPARISLGAWA